MYSVQLVHFFMDRSPGGNRQVSLPWYSPDRVHGYECYCQAYCMGCTQGIGLLIAKDRMHGGFPFEVFSKLYDSLVQPIMDLGTSVWGHKPFSCIDAVQNRAMRNFLGVGKRTPVAAMQGDIGWSAPAHRQWLYMCNSTVVQTGTNGSWTN